MRFGIVRVSFGRLICAAGVVAAPSLRCSTRERMVEIFRARFVCEYAPRHAMRTEKCRSQEAEWVIQTQRIRIGPTESRPPESGLLVNCAWASNCQVSTFAEPFELPRDGRSLRSSTALHPQVVFELGNAFLNTEFNRLLETWEHL